MKRAIETVLLICCYAATSAAQRDTVPADDRQLVDALMQAVYVQVVAVFAPYPFQPPADVAWTIHVPADAEWQREIVAFKRLVRARDTLPTDQARYSLELSQTSRSADTAIYDGDYGSVGRETGCANLTWNGASADFRLIATHARGQPWLVQREWGTMGDPAACEPPDRIFGVEEAKFVDAATQFLTAEMQRTGRIPVHPPHEVAWTIVLPSEAAWQNAAPRIKALLHARDTTKSDREFYSLRINQLDVTPDSTRLVAVIDRFSRNSRGAPAQFTGSWSTIFDANAHRAACASWAMALDGWVIADPSCPPRPKVPRSPAAHPSAETSRAQRAPAPADDKQLVDAVMEAVRAQVMQLALYPRQPTAAIAWTIAVPADAEWQRSARGFKRLVHARDTMPSDTTRYSLHVRPTGRFADSATYVVDYEVSHRFSCPTNTQWIGGGDSFYLTAIRRDSVWAVRMGELIDADPGMCVPPTKPPASDRRTQ